jgi:hypothetical protein
MTFSTFFFFYVGVPLQGRAIFDPPLQSKFRSRTSDSWKFPHMELIKSLAFHESVVSIYFYNFFKKIIIKKKRNCNFLTATYGSPYLGLPYKACIYNFILLLFFFFFNVGVPLQGKAISIHPCRVNSDPVHHALRKEPRLGLKKSWAFHESVVSIYFSHFFIKKRKKKKKKKQFSKRGTCATLENS